MALHTLIWTKPPTPYLRPPPIHLRVVMVAEQPRVVAWEFDASGARPASTKHNVLAAISDGKSVAKVTIYEEFSSTFQEGRSYVLRGHSLRGQPPPYLIHINKETMFFRSAPIQMSEELKQQAEALIRPISLLTQLSSCSEAKGLVTVEGEVIELSTLKKITTGKEVFPMRNKLQQEVSSEDVVGAFGVVDVEGEPGSLNLLLDDGRTVVIAEAPWTPIEPLLINPPLKVGIKLTGSHVTTIETVE